MSKDKQKQPQQQTEDSSCCGNSITTKVQILGANKILRAQIPISCRSSNGDDVKTVELIGRSWAADATGFCVPSLGIALDAGYPVYGKRMPDILVTHLHTDHAHHLTHIKSRHKPSTAHVPASTVKLAERYIDVAQMMTSNLTPQEYNEIDWDVDLRFQGVMPGERIKLSRKGLMCDIVQCDHSVPCVGYIVSRCKSTLKSQHKGLNSNEIGKLRKEQGVNFTEETTEPLLCFLGDTIRWISCNRMLPLPMLF